ncbi:MAG: hypothetical protein R6T92_02360 [Desulfosalsimonadaceae bacterium]
MDKQHKGIERIDGATIDMVREEKALEDTGVFKNIRIEAFTVPSQHQSDYAYELNEFQGALLFHIKGKNKFDSVEALEQDTSGSLGKNTLKVEGEILDMRIASPGARMWGGALAGSSYMDIYLRLVDNEGAVLQEKIIATHNNAYAAAWAAGSSDRSMPRDMAEIIGEYLVTVIPSE